MKCASTHTDYSENSSKRMKQCFKRGTRRTDKFMFLISIIYGTDKKFYENPSVRFDRGEVT